MSTTYDEETAALAAQEEQVRRARMVSGLRELADTLEQFPGLPVPFVSATVYTDSLDQARAARRGIHGWAKRNSAGSAYVTYEKMFGQVELGIYVSKSGACERVQVGTTHVEAVEAHDEPVYEWRCEPGSEAAT